MTEIREGGHWVHPEFKQRITKQQWKQLLLDEKDTIVFRGRVVKLKAKNLGCGVLEISKDLGKES